MPVSGTVCGLVPLTSLIVRLPVAAPFAFGVNVTVIVQLLPAAKLAAQLVLDTAKTLVVAMFVTGSAAVPLFRSVTVLGGLVVPTETVPNDSFASFFKK